MMSDSLYSINERYNMILDKIENIKANLHVIHDEQLELTIKELEKLEESLKQLEDLYPEEVSGRPI
jgi:archaellum component FlaC